MISTTTRRIRIGASLLALAAGLNCHGQTTATPQTADQTSCKRFVQTFYDHYNNLKTSYEKVFGAHTSDFEPQLQDLLRRQIRTQAAHPGEVTGLDFDPFLAAQNIDGGYRVTGTETTGDTCTAKVSGPEVDLTITAHKAATTWRFADFAYSTRKQTLVGLLQQSQKPATPKLPQ